MDKNRFIEIEYGSVQNVDATYSIIADKVTGVNYLVYEDEASSSITPLLGADGKPVVTPLEELKNL